MALISDPDILFLDEPTSGLDVISARTIRSFLLKLKEQGKTIVLTTHNIDEAGMLCDRVAIMDKGKIIARGTPKELKIRFGEYTRILLCFDKEVDAKLIREYLNPYEVVVQGRRLVVICRSKDLRDILDQVVCIAKEYGLSIEEIRASGLDFEDVFIKVIGESG